MARPPVDPPPPVEEDLRYDDEGYNPAVEPRKSKAWLNLIAESEKAFDDYNMHCDNIDKQYANLLRLCSNTRDKEFQMFWANAEVLKPSIYAKKPVPVVKTKFSDQRRRPVHQAASEMMERTAIVAFDLAEIDDLMKLVRDDLGLLDRGVAWCRYESGKGKGYHGYEKVCIDFKHRKDFLHSLGRNWREVTWVAAASYLTRSEARKRFYKTSKDAYQDAEYKSADRQEQDIGGVDNRERAKFWEVWDKNSERVLWVSTGCEDILDEADPHLELRNFFPCPQPAYGTLQRGSLVPVPDVLQYKDQLEELNLLTARIHALSDAVEAKGFYPAGGGEIADAVQQAVSLKTPGRVLIPVKNWAAFGGSKEIIVWLPIEAIAQTITALVAVRKEIINDIYQIMGLSDIMRGATDPNETLGAQQLKTQYGSTRIRDKQQELVRLARDLVEITTEIITEKFDPVTIIEMSQTDLITQQMQREQVMQLQQQMQGQQQAMQMAMQNPQLQAMAQQNPQGAQQLMQQGQELLAQGQKAIAKIMEKPTVEQVLAFLKNNRAKAFALDIETDSTIMIDEQAEKKNRGEFVGVLGQLLPQIAQMVGAEPKTAPFAGELIKFALAPYRAGRSMEGAIDDLVETMKLRSDSPPPNPEAEKIKAQGVIEKQKLDQQKAKDEADTQVKRDTLASQERQHGEKLRNDIVIKKMELDAKKGETQNKAALANLDAMHAREDHQMDMVESAQKMRENDQKMALANQQAAIKASDMQQRSADRREAQQFKQQQALMNPPRRQ